MSIVLKLAVNGSTKLLRGQAHYWKVMRDQHAEHGSFTISSIDRASRVARQEIATFIRRLDAAGYIECVGSSETHSSPEKHYRIVRNQAECPRLSKGHVQQTGQRNMWNLLRGPMGREGITARDLAAFASTEELPVGLETAKSYIKTLSVAGYLACLAKGGPGKPAVWRLKPAMNTGPLPPMILRSKMVYDQNADRIMGDVLAEEEPA